MRQLVSLLFVSLLLLGGVWFSDAFGRTWVASPEGGEDGLFADLLWLAAEADTIRLLSGTHQWSSAGGIQTSLCIRGDDGAFIEGNSMLVLNVEWFEFHNVEFFRTGQLVVARSGRIVFDSCVYREGQWAAAFEVIQSLVIRNSVFSDNYSRNRGSTAGLKVNSADSLTVEACLFARNSSESGSPYNEFPGDGGGALRVIGCTNATIRKNVFRNNHAIAGSALYFHGDTILAEGNTFFENDCTAASMIVYLEGGKDRRGAIRQNIFANSTSFGLWIGSGVPAPPRVYCNAFWENVDLGGPVVCRPDGGQWWTCFIQPGYEGINDFHSVLADPMFCSDDSLYVSMDSELAAPTGKPCSPIGGALGFDCGIKPIISKSWGAVKQSFHGQWSSGSRRR